MMRLAPLLVSVGCGKSMAFVLGVTSTKSLTAVFLTCSGPKRDHLENILDIMWYLVWD